MARIDFGDLITVVGITENPRSSGATRRQGCRSKDGSNKVTRIAAGNCRIGSDTVGKGVFNRVILGNGIAEGINRSQCDRVAHIDVNV